MGGSIGYLIIISLSPQTYHIYRSRSPDLPVDHPMGGMFLEDVNDRELCVPPLPQLQVVDHLHNWTR